MCVIYTCTEKIPAMEELEQGALLNSDGAGISWVENGLVHWKKGLPSDPNEVMKFITDKKLNFPVILHFRAASIGGKDDSLCHPFPIAENAPTALEGSAESVLFQNGTWTKYDSVLRDTVLFNSGLKMPDGGWSDTRALAFLAYHKGWDILTFLADDSRIAVMTNLEETPIFYWGKWIEKEGYSQSIDTDIQWNRRWPKSTAGKAWQYSGPHGGWRHFGDGGWEDAWDDEDVSKEKKGDIIVYRGGEKGKEEAAEKEATTKSQARSEMETWSVEELKKLLLDLEMELLNARSESSIY